MTYEHVLARGLTLACLALIPPTAASASPNLVTNGDFEQTTMMDAQGNFTPEQMTTTNVTGWSTSGYNFVFGAGTASTVGSTGVYGPTYIWSGSAVAGGPVLSQSPTGGNFVGADGAFGVGAITQTLSGLMAGANYAVSFWWAGAQQSGYNGTTTEQWQVGLGNQTQSTAVVTDPSNGFTGWMQQTFIFQATGSSEVLSFLAAGTPGGEPPFSLLDGVSATQVPEPASMALSAFGAGLILLVMFRCRRLSVETSEAEAAARA